MKVHELIKLLQSRCNDEEDVFFYHKLHGSIMPESITIPIECKTGASEGVILSGKPKRYCCRMGCDKPAEWQIWHGDTPDDYTESCTECIGQMLTDAHEHTILSIKGLRPVESVSKVFLIEYGDGWGINFGDPNSSNGFKLTGDDARNKCLAIKRLFEVE